MTVQVKRRRKRVWRPKPGVFRPTCDRVDESGVPHSSYRRVELGGFIHARTDHQRPIYICAEGDGKGPGKRHRIRVETLPRRRPKESHPHTGAACPHCEHVYERHEGQVTARGYVFAVDEVAKALIEIGRGATLRGTGETIRRGLWRDRIDVPGEYSREGRLVSAWIDHYAPVVLAPFAPTKWPPVVAIDSVPLKKMAINAHGRRVSVDAGEVMIAVDHSRPARRGKPLLMAIGGGKDHQTWMEFLSRLSGHPRHIVADRGLEIGAAVRRLWGNKTVLYACEGHLQRNASDAADEDGVALYRRLRKKVEVTDKRGQTRKLQFEPHPIREAIPYAMSSEKAFDILIERVMRYRGKKAAMLRFLSGAEGIVRAQAAYREANPSLPFSTGYLEGALTDFVRKSFSMRAHAFANVRRINLILGLMTLEKRGDARVEVYRGLIRDYLEQHDGRSAYPWTNGVDPLGISSLHETIVRANQRQALARAENQAEDARQRRKRDAERAAARRAEGRSRTTPRETPVGVTYRSVAGRVVADFDDLMAQWHPANPEDPATVPAGRHAAALWKCENHLDADGYAWPPHLHEWSASIRSRASQEPLPACPFCASRRACPGNSLRALYPQTAAEWHPTKNEMTPDDVLPFAKTEAWWKCEARGHVFARRIDHYVQSPNCPKCVREAKAKARKDKEREFQRNYARKVRATAKQLQASEDAPQLVRGMVLDPEDEPF